MGIDLEDADDAIEILDASLDDFSPNSGHKKKKANKVKSELPASADLENQPNDMVNKPLKSKDEDFEGRTR